ncbi:MAG: hypothetical protein ACYC9S_10510 [Leptospirales bacterium]
MLSGVDYSDRRWEQFLGRKLRGQCTLPTKAIQSERGGSELAASGAQEARLTDSVKQLVDLTGELDK